MLKVLTFMKQVANGLQMEGNFGTAHVYRSSLNAIITYRWSGTKYSVISETLALGEVTGTAYDGGKGKKTDGRFMKRACSIFLFPKKKIVLL